MFSRLCSRGGVAPPYPIEAGGGGGGGGGGGAKGSGTGRAAARTGVVFAEPVPLTFWRLAVEVEAREEGFVGVAV